MVGNTHTIYILYFKATPVEMHMVRGPNQEIIHPKMISVNIYSPTCHSKHFIFSLAWNKIFYLRWKWKCMVICIVNLQKNKQKKTKMQHRVNVQYSALKITCGQVNETRTWWIILFKCESSVQDDSMKQTCTDTVNTT